MGDERIVRGVLTVGRLVEHRRLGGLDGISVSVRGQPVVERHWTPNVRRDVYSVSKTLVSLAVGVAQAEGRLSPDDALLHHLDHLRPTAAEGTETITIQQLLTMTSGVVHRWDEPTMKRADENTPRAQTRSPTTGAAIAARHVDGRADGCRLWNATAAVHLVWLRCRG